MIDKFLNKIFSLGRIIAAFVVLICLVVIVGGGLYFLVSGSEGVSKPDFDDYIETKEDSSESGSGGYSELSERRAVEKKYGDDIQEVLELGNISEDGFDIYINKLVDMDEAYRSTFVKGLKRFLKDGAKYIEKNEKEAKFNTFKLANAYDGIFEGEIMKAEISKLESKAKRMGSLIAIGSALVAMILFLVIPLLIQIELNTRKDLKIEEEEAGQKVETTETQPE